MTNNGVIDGVNDGAVPTSVPMVGARHPFDLSAITQFGPFRNIFVSFEHDAQS